MISNGMSIFNCNVCFRMYPVVNDLHRSYIVFVDMLLSENVKDICEVINMGLGIMPCFMKFCNNDENPELQNESLWAMANITSGPSECIKHVINNDGINILINIFQSPLYEIKEHVLWSLGNIAADSLELKDLLFTNNILSNILQIYKHKYDKKYVTNFSNSPTITKHPMQQYINLLTTCSWVLSNLCRQSAPPNIKYLNDLIKCLKVALEQALNMNDNINTKQNGMIGKKNEIIINIAWGFSYLTGFDKYDEYLMNKMDEINITKHVVELMDHESVTIRKPINRLIGNILTGSDEHTKICLDLGILTKYAFILNNLGLGVAEQREICWSISNVCATNNINDKLLVLKHGLFVILIGYLQNGTYEIGKESLWAISNATTGSNKMIIDHLIENNVQIALVHFVQKYQSCFTNKKNKILIVVLECIENILIIDEQNRFSQLFEECGIVSFLKDMKQNDEDDIYDLSFGYDFDDDVYKKVDHIMDKYYSSI